MMSRSPDATLVHPDRTSATTGLSAVGGPNSDRGTGNARDDGRSAASRRMPLGRWLRTTPGLIRLLAAVAVVALVAAWATGTAALTQRRDAVESVATSSGPKLVTAGELYASLAAADATASSALLRPGTEPEAVRDRYREDLERAERLLVDIGGSADLSTAAQDSTGIIATQLSTYVGWVETARTNRRYENPVSAAYMRAASAQMREEILPAATAIWSDAALQLDDDFGTGTSLLWPVAFAVTGGLAIAALLALSVFLALRTKRVLNLGVVAALALVVAGGTLSFVVMANEHEALVRARQEGMDPMQTLSAAYFLGLQGQADANLALAERDTRQAYLDELDAFSLRVAGSDESPGLLDAARSMAARTGDASGVVATDLAFEEYREIERALRLADDGGGHESAVATALSDRPGGLANAATRVNDRFETAIATSERRFTSATADARTGSGVVVIGLAVALLAAGACVLVGVQPRIGEYR